MGHCDIVTFWAAKADPVEVTVEFVTGFWEFLNDLGVRPNGRLDFGACVGGGGVCHGRVLRGWAKAAGRVLGATRAAPAMLGGSPTAELP